jgi:hypothetical protein
MNRFGIGLSAIVFAAFGLGVSSMAQAQATRTWVSGVGDDVNPCSRTAPCKTFAGAISKTAAGGEISVLDPGGFGAVTINKSITIDGGTGSGWASILNSATNGVNIIAAATDTVTLRNLTINGAGPNPGLNGIRIAGGRKVFIENVQVFGNLAADPNGRGITDVRTTNGQLFISNSVIRNNGQSGVVILAGTGATTIDVQLSNVQLIGNGNAGLTASTGSNVTMIDSIASGNVNYGVFTNQPAGTTTLFLSNVTMSDNGAGLFIGAGPPTVRLSNVTITNNTTGLAGNTALTSTFNNNKISGNGGGNGPFSPALTSVGSQ